MSLRDDGATRGDLAEATALVVGGTALLFLPLLALLDRLARGWMILCGVAAVGGLAVAVLGLRWFLKEGPLLGHHPVDAASMGAPVDVPVAVRLVDARHRLQAHVLRFAALATAGLFVLVDLPGLGWLVVLLFVASFVADHVLLRPKRYILDEEGLHTEGLGAHAILRWAEVQRVLWRHYPGPERPPFPGGERLVVEREGGEDKEFVFHRKYGGTAAELVVRALAPIVGRRLVALRPGRPQARDEEAARRRIAEAVGDDLAARSSEEAEPSEGASGAGERP